MSYDPQPYDPRNAYPPPAQPQYAPPQYPMVVAVSAPTSGWATASLVFGIFGLLGGFCLFAIPCIVAVICGHVGLSATKDGSRGGRGMAVAGLILGYVVVGPAIVFLVFGGLGTLIGAVDPSATATPTP